MKLFVYLLLFCLLGCTTNVQNINVSDLVKLANFSHPQATQYLVTEKDFKLISSKNIYGQIISQYYKLNSKTDELIIKDQWRDTDKIVRAIIHYDVKPVSYANIIIKELLQSNFKLISKIDDTQKHVRLYDDGSYLVSIYTFSNPKLPASIELHVK